MRPQPRRVLMVDPEYFDVAYAINPHMEGQIGKVDRKKARTQWEALKGAYEKIGLNVVVLPAVKGLPDMVFAANQSFPFLGPRGEKNVFLSQMATKEREPEVAYFEQWYRKEGYAVHVLQTSAPFEGMGDLVWHPDQKMLWGGFGFRTDAQVYEEIGQTGEVPVQGLKLVNPDFYHLDTCLAPLRDGVALYYPKAFDASGLKLLKTHFNDLIEVPKNEALQGFACNGHCPDGRHVLLQKGSAVTCRSLRARGFEPVELETSEFLKSGGSVFCLKMMVY